MGRMVYSQGMGTLSIQQLKTILELYPPAGDGKNHALNSAQIIAGTVWRCMQMLFLLERAL